MSEVAEVSQVEVVPVSLSVPKESKEVVDAVAGIVADIRAKRPVAEIAVGALPKLLVAVEGFDQLDDEAKSKQRSDLAAYLVKNLLDSIVPGV